jgi:hypothetical protein
MLNLPFGRVRFCDGISRRSMLQVGALSFGAMGLTLADVLRAEAAAKKNDALPRTRHKAVINIFLGGGPPHQDMWDLKPDAPAEIRGEFKPISTKVPGVQIGETFTRIAKAADKFAFIRSVVGAKGGHDAFQCTTGWPQQSLAPLGGRPSIGSCKGTSIRACRRSSGWPKRRSTARGAIRAKPGSSGARSRRSNRAARTC